MSFFRRKEAADPVQHETLVEGYSPEAVALEFIDNEKNHLALSASEWGEVYSSYNELRSDVAHVFVREGVDEYAEANGGFVQERERQHITSRAVDDFATLAFMTSREMSINGVFSGSINPLGKFMDQLPVDAHYFLAQDMQATKGLYIKPMAKMYACMQQADKISTKILSKFVKDFDTKTDSYEALADLYNESAAAVHPGFKELKEIVRTDLYRQDTDNSVLNTWLEEVKSNPDAFIDSFIEKVVNTPEDRKLVQIRNMARFALAATKAEETNSSIKSLLRETSSQWSEFVEIDELFEQFRSTSIQKIETALKRIAGPEGESNPRLPKTQEDIKFFKGRMQFDMKGNREERRKRARAPGARMQHPTKLNIESVVEADKRMDREAKPIFFVRRVQGNGFIKEAPDKEKTLEDFVKEKVDTHLVEDITACINKINEDPISPASLAIVSGNGIKVDGKTVKLRRFKPNHGARLNISSEAASYRICYGILNGSVVIADILSHDQFDKKYK